MTDEEMVAEVKAVLADTRLDGFAETYLGFAKSAIVSWMWPYDPEKGWEDVPERHHQRCVEIAVYLINRRGAEGEMTHSENGVYRMYDGAGVPASMFRGIVPFAGVPS